MNNGTGQHIFWLSQYSPEMWQSSMLTSGYFENEVFWRHDTIGRNKPLIFCLTIFVRWKSRYFVKLHMAEFCPATSFHVHILFQSSRTPTLLTFKIMAQRIALEYKFSRHRSMVHCFFELFPEILFCLKACTHESNVWWGFFLKLRWNLCSCQLSCGH